MQYVCLSSMVEIYFINNTCPMETSLTKRYSSKSMKKSVNNIKTFPHTRCISWYEKGILENCNLDFKNPSFV